MRHRINLLDNRTSSVSTIDTIIPCNNLVSPGSSTSIDSFFDEPTSPIGNSLDAPPPSLPIGCTNSLDAPSLPIGCTNSLDAPPPSRPIYYTPQSPDVSPPSGPTGYTPQSPDVPPPSGPTGYTPQSPDVPPPSGPISYYTPPSMDASPSSRPICYPLGSAGAPPSSRPICYPLGSAGAPPPTHRSIGLSAGAPPPTRQQNELVDLVSDIGDSDLENLIVDPRIQALKQELDTYKRAYYHMSKVIEQKDLQIDFFVSQNNRLFKMTDLLIKELNTVSGVRRPSPYFRTFDKM